MDFTGMKIGAGSARKTTAQAAVTPGGGPLLAVDADPGRADTVRGLIEDAGRLCAFRGHDRRITDDLYPPSPERPGERLRLVGLASIVIHGPDSDEPSPALNSQASSSAVLDAITGRGWRPAGLHDLVRYAIDPGGWDRSATVIAPASAVTLPGDARLVIGMLVPAGGRGYLDLSEHDYGQAPEGKLLVAESR